VQRWPSLESPCRRRINTGIVLDFHLHPTSGVLSAPAYHLSLHHPFCPSSPRNQYHHRRLHLHPNHAPRLPYLPQALLAFRTSTLDRSIYTSTSTSTIDHRPSATTITHKLNPDHIHQLTRVTESPINNDTTARESHGLASMRLHQPTTPTNESTTIQTRFHCQRYNCAHRHAAEQGRYADQRQRLSDTQSVSGSAQGRIEEHFHHRWESIAMLVGWLVCMLPFFAVLVHFPNPMLVYWLRCKGEGGERPVQVGCGEMLGLRGCFLLGVVMGWCDGVDGTSLRDWHWWIADLVLFIRT
jgi:hypothetical protein